MPVHAPQPMCKSLGLQDGNKEQLLNSLVEKKEGVYSSETFRTRAVAWLSGAVQVKYVSDIRLDVNMVHKTDFGVWYRTESYDKMPPVGEDPRWEAFGPFHDYLLKAFPLV